MTMYPKYEDLLALAKRADAGEPKWWNEHSVSRYSTFHPDLLGIYDNFAVLAKITCASCGTVMLVEMGRLRFPGFRTTPVPCDLASVVGIIEAWGDPPRHDLCSGVRCAGETMSAESVQIVQVWKKGADFEWHHGRVI